MNLDFSPTHCLFCYKKIHHKHDTNIYSTTWCTDCKISGGENMVPAYLYHQNQGKLYKIEIRVRNWHIIWQHNETTIEQVKPYQMLHKLPYLLDFDFNPELLVHKIHTLLIFS